MRFFLVFCMFWPLPAFAHVGHLADVAGHSHWWGIAAIGAAAVAAAWAGRKGKGEDEEADVESESSEEEPQEA